MTTARLSIGLKEVAMVCGTAFSLSACVPSSSPHAGGTPPQGLPSKGATTVTTPAPPPQASAGNLDRNCIEEQRRLGNPYPQRVCGPRTVGDGTSVPVGHAPSAIPVFRPPSPAAPGTQGQPIQPEIRQPDRIQRETMEQRIGR